MAINFPSSPATNDTYTYGGKTYTFTGTVWTVDNGARIYNNPTPPPSPSAGALWFNTETGELNAYYDDATSSQWVVIGGSPPINYPSIPQVISSANRTTLLSDAGGHIYHPASDTTARTWTIDSNANVPYAIGTAIVFVNEIGAGIITIAITADTMIFAGSGGGTGNRTLPAGASATALKTAATRWMISGTGMT